MASNNPNHSDPPGKIKIAEALRNLLKEKDFNSITTADISISSKKKISILLLRRISPEHPVSMKR